MTTVLLLGDSGYVGQAFQRYFKAFGIPYKTSPFRRDAALPSIVMYKPTFVINAAGYTGKPNVDACEDNKGECLDGNAVWPGKVRAICEANGITWGHVSSGCIYKNYRLAADHAFREDDVPNFTFRRGPSSWYSGTKALGEEVLEGAKDCYIWRLRIPFSEVDGDRNYLSKVMRYPHLLDVENSMSQIDEFVWACWQTMVTKAPFGTYNVTNPGSMYTHGVVNLIKRAGLCKDKQWLFFKNEHEFMKTVRTPRSSCVMDSSKLASVGIKMSPLHEAIARDLTRWKPA